MQGYQLSRVLRFASLKHFFVLVVVVVYDHIQRYPGVYHITPYALESLIRVNAKKQ